MDEFDHFLITRFNLKSRLWTKDKNETPLLTDEWLEHRLGLFDGWCLPSVTQQSVKNFTWLIYFSSDTIASVRSRVAAMTNAYSWIRILYIPDQEAFMANVRSDIQKFRTPQCAGLITTRIDNDDVIHPEMMQTVQQQFKSQAFMAVNFTLVYCLKIEGAHRLYCEISFSNHFISLIEHAIGDDFFTCYSKRDREWNEKGKIIQIGGQPCCMELIHSRNIGNEIRGFPVFSRRRLDTFNLMFNSQLAFQLSDLFFWRMPWMKLIAFLFRK